MAKTSDVVRTVAVGDETANVILGDTIWWYPENATHTVPHVGTLTQFCEGNKVNLTRQSPSGSQIIHEKGVCLIGDPDLQNPNHRKRGSWCPRIGWKALNLKG